MIDYDEKDLKLVYVHRIGKNSSDLYEYEFFFSTAPDTAWGVDWNVPCPASCGDMKPDPTTYSIIKRLKSDIPFTGAQKNTYFSLQDMIDNIIACAWEDISEYDNFPEPYRIVFQFGEDYASVERKLASRSQFFDDTIAYGDDGLEGNGEIDDNEQEDELDF